MPNDSFTVRALVGELANLCTGAKINKISQTQREEFILGLYTKNGGAKLLINAGANMPRIHLARTEYANVPVPTAFCMTLRKYLHGGVIKSITAPVGERIARLEIESRTELMDSAVRVLYVEIFGRNSNLILCDGQNSVITALKTRSLDAGIGRTLLPKTTYTLPQNSDRTNPGDKDAVLKLFWAFSGGSFSQFMADNLAGISRVTARHIALEFLPSDSVTGTPDKDFAYAAQSALEGFERRILSGNYQPCISQLQGVYSDFFPFPYNSSDCSVSGFDSFNDCADSFFYHKQHTQKLQALRQSATALLSSLLKKTRKKIALLSARMEEYQNAELYQKYGELLTAYIYAVPKNANSVTVSDYYNEGADIDISLQQNLSPQQNAQRYYKLYRKSKTGTQLTAKQLAEVSEYMQYLQSVQVFLSGAEDTQTLTQIAQELRQNTGTHAQKLPNSRKSDMHGNNAKRPAKKVKTKSAAPTVKGAAPLPAKVCIDGFTVYYGRSNLQNDHLTFRMAKSDDIWLHVKDYHGAHVVISAEGKAVPHAVIEQAALLAAQKSRATGKTAVDFCMRKNVKKAPGAPLGKVYYTGQNTVIVNVPPPL